MYSLARREGYRLKKAKSIARYVYYIRGVPLDSGHLTTSSTSIDVERKLRFGNTLQEQSLDWFVYG